MRLLGCQFDHLENHLKARQPSPPAPLRHCGSALGALGVAFQQALVGFVCTPVRVASLVAGCWPETATCVAIWLLSVLTGAMNTHVLVSTCMLCCPSSSSVGVVASWSWCGGSGHTRSRGWGFEHKGPLSPTQVSLFTQQKRRPTPVRARRAGYKASTVHRVCIHCSPSRGQHGFWGDNNILGSCSGP